MPLLDAFLLEPAPFDVWISASRTDSLFGSGTEADPWDGSTQAKFDNLMRQLAVEANTEVRIHLGPGTFMTRGYSDAETDPTKRWEIKPGMKIAGSGVDVTFLQLVNAATAGGQYYAVGHQLVVASVANPVDDCEVSDLTIDCALPATGQVACGAVRLMGSHVRVQRVKAKNWGNGIPPATSTKPSFVFGLIIAEQDTGAVTVDSGLEGCVAIEPATPGVAGFGEVLIFHAGGKDYDATKRDAFGIAPYIRNCFADAKPLSGSELGDGTNFQTKLRGLSMGVCRSGVVEGNQVHNTWIGGPYQTQWSAREIVIRHNYYRNVVKAVSWDPVFPTTSFTITAFTRLGAPSTVIQATTSADAKLNIGDRVRISGAPDVLVGGLPQDVLNGVFVVKDVINTPPSGPFKFQYEVSARPDADPTGATATLRKVLGAEKVLLEGNVVELAQFEAGWETPIAFYLADTANASQPLGYLYGDVTIRQNKVHYWDNAFEATFLGYGIDVIGARNLIIENNIVESAVTNPIRNQKCGAVGYFNNETPQGTLVRGINQDTGIKYGELETDAEDAFVLALLRR